MGEALKRDFSHILVSQGRFQERGIMFRLGTPEDAPKVSAFMKDEFMPDEPVLRSMGLGSPKSKVQKLINSETRKDLMKKCLKKSNSCSVIAVNGEGEILGIKLGYIMKEDQKLSHMLYYPWLRHFYWAAPKDLVLCNTVMWYVEEQLGYHPNKVMKELKAKSLFEGEVLGVSSKARGLGLGKEMVKMSMAIAKELGCEIYFACVSGIYSQKIYRDLGAIVIKELQYDDVRDKNGKKLLNDTREHTKAQNVYIKL